MTTSLVDTKHIAIRSIQVMADGALADFEAIVHPRARNRESVDEPPAARGEGPDAFYATALWLRGIFADLRWSIDNVAAEGDLVAIRGTMSGRHVGPFVSYGEDALPAQVFPPTGKSFASTQTHWLRISDGKVVEHWANRDDLGTSLQLGWVPPSPLYIVRMKLALRRAPGKRSGPIGSAAGRSVATRADRWHGGGLRFPRVLGACPRAMASQPELSQDGGAVRTGRRCLGGGHCLAAGTVWRRAAGVPGAYTMALSWRPALSWRRTPFRRARASDSCVEHFDPVRVQPPFRLTRHWVGPRPVGRWCAICLNQRGTRPMIPLPSATSETCPPCPRQFRRFCISRCHQNGGGAS